MKFIFSIQARHIYICDHHKELIQSLRTKRKRKDSEDDSGETDSEHPEVDLYQLQVNTLRRYKKHYKVPVRQGLNKAQLADVSTSHKCNLCGSLRMKTNYNVNIIIILFLCF